MQSTNLSKKAKPAMNNKNTNVLTLADFKGMRDRAHISNPNEEQERKQQQKKELKDKSDARVQNWPNTIQALRRKKDDAKFERFQQDEIERRKIDVEEAEYQAGVKKDILAKANKQIYETNDRVKAFQSALLVSDALKEREAQVEINERKKEIAKIVEEKYHEMEKENMKAYDEKEEDKKKVEEKKKKEAQKILRDQHDQFKQKHIKKMQEDKIEGEIVKIKAQEALEKEREEERKRKQKAIDAQEETRKGNELLNEIRHQEKLKEIAKDKEIEAFAKRKDEILEMRKMREELKFKERQDARQKIIDAQVAELKKIKDKEDLILNKHIKEAEIKAEENERIKKEKRDQLVKEIDKQIGLTLDKRRVEKETKKIEDRNFQEFWKNKNKELEEKEREDKEAAKNRSKNLQNYHAKQHSQKQQQLEEEIRKEYEDAMRMQAAAEEEDKIFNSYAQKAIQEWDQNGKNVKPLLLELQKYKKKNT